MRPEPLRAASIPAANIANAAMLAAIDEAGHAVLVLCEGVEVAEFRRSRIAKAEVFRQLETMVGLLLALPQPTRDAMAEIDFRRWQLLGEALHCGPETADAAAWDAARELVPETLMWLRVYRKTMPGVFQMRG